MEYLLNPGISKEKMKPFVDLLVAWFRLRWVHVMLLAWLLLAWGCRLAILYHASDMASVSLHMMPFVCCYPSEVQEGSKKCLTSTQFCLLWNIAKVRISENAIHKHGKNVFWLLLARHDCQNHLLQEKQAVRTIMIRIVQTSWVTSWHVKSLQQGNCTNG